ncbi:MAG: hypothetical protein ACKVQQ_05080 [Burkholderiales bacterium]
MHACWGLPGPIGGFGLGVIDIKKTEAESADRLAREIECAEKLLGAGRVRCIHPASRREP